MEKFFDKKCRLLLYLLILVGVLASFTVIFERITKESENRSTLLSLEWVQLTEIAARQGVTADEMLEYLQTYDDEPLISGMVYKEPSIYEWKTAGELLVKIGSELSTEVKSGIWRVEDETLIDNSYNYVICPTEEMQERVYENLVIKTSANINKFEIETGETMFYAVSTTMPSNDLVSLGIGFDDEALATMAKYDLDVVVQIRSWQVVTEESIEYVYGDLAEMGFVAVGFNDSGVPGVTQQDWADVKVWTADILEEQGLPMMTIEFYSQSGTESLAAEMDYDLVRLHPVSEAEVAKLTPESVVDRFQLAASERTMGVLMLRLYPSESLEYNAQLISDVVAGVNSKLVPTDEISTVVDMDVKPWVIAVVTLAVAAGGALLMELFGFKKLAVIFPILGAVAIWGLLGIGQISWAQKLLALSAVILFPTLAVANFVEEKNRSLPKAILALLAMSAVSLIGAVLEMGILSESSYMSGINVFSGVKVGQLLPLMILGLYFLYKIAMENGGTKYLLVTFVKFLKKEINIGMVLVAGVAGVILLVYMIRTGNTSSSISGIEQALRTFLDDVMFARPRTKEFLIGVPIMLAMLYYGRVKLLWPVVLLGAISQVSMVNTFEHLHTPVLISALRTVNGIVLGVVIGVILIYGIKYVGGWAWKKCLEISAMADAEVVEFEKSKK